jgi:hypothetical protein
MMHVEVSLMHRTTIMLPAGLKLDAQRLAQERGVSLGDLVREALSSLVQNVRQGAGRQDPLFADNEIWDGDVPADLSSKVDTYLYGEDA